MVLGDFFMRQTRRAENLGELVRINSADVRFPFIPAHLDPSGVMGEEVEVQLKAVFAVRFDNAHHLVQVPGLAVRSQRHYLSLIPVIEKSEILGDGGIKETERVRKQHGIQFLDVSSRAATEHGAAEITKAVHGKQGRFLERRDQERAGHVRHVVLHIVKFHLEVGLANAKGVRQHGLDISNPVDVAQTVQALLCEHETVVKNEGYLVDEVRAGNAGNSDVIHFRNGNTRTPQAIPDRVRGKARGVLHPAKPLLFDCSHDAPVLEKNCRCVSVVGIYSKNVGCFPHLLPLRSTRPILTDLYRLL